MMHTFLLLLLLADVAMFGCKNCHTGDKAALLVVMAALGNPYQSSYLCCDWHNVDCDPATGCVIGLSVFKDDNITGTILATVAGLTHLQTIALHHLPMLSGPIPPAIGIGNLANLSQPTISWTAMSGSVPSFLGVLAKLTLLDLSFNSLSGAIPASLSRIPSLSGINLSRNHLLNVIPPLLLCKTTDQVYLWISHNNLSGAIPAEFAAVDFAHVDLSRNTLTGDASVLFGRQRLSYLDLSRNALSFDLSGMVFPEQLTFVDVSHNDIRGGIPAQVANLTNLVQLKVSYNRLCGVVPGGAAGFNVYSLQHNKCLHSPNAR